MVRGVFSTEIQLEKWILNERRKDLLEREGNETVQVEVEEERDGEGHGDEEGYDEYDGRDDSISREE